MQANIVFDGFQRQTNKYVMDGCLGLAYQQPWRNCIPTRYPFGFIGVVSKPPLHVWGKCEHLRVIPSLA
jgi:hypothetical protein